MKIGIVLPDLPKYSETFFNTLISALTESGYKVILFTGKKNSNEILNKCVLQYKVYEGKIIRQSLLMIYVLSVTFLKCPARFLKLFNLEKSGGKSMIEALKIIYINAHILPHKLDRLHFGFATMALKRETVAKSMGAEMSVSFRGYDINVYPLKNPGCYGRLWENVDMVHTISEYLYKKAIDLGLHPDTAYKKITPSVNTGQFAFKKNNLKHDGMLRILTVGRLHWIKDYETAISAMNILNQSNVNFTYNIIGDGVESERLKYAVYQYGLQDKINFLGKKNISEISEFMSNSDIYLQTSLQEGFCVSVLEAQASGMLCIVSDADGLKENVVNNVTGWIVEKRNPRAFAEKIFEILKKNDTELNTISSNARMRIEKEFSYEEQKKLFRQFFELNS